MGVTYRPFTLLHCADLHLDATLGDSVRESSSIDISKEEDLLLRDAPSLALENIQRIAIENEVDCIVIAGDLFDSKNNATNDQRVRSRLTNFFKKMEEANTQIFVTVGNHDPIRSIQKLAMSWPKNVHLFSSTKPETYYLERDDIRVAIHGVSYASNEELRDLSSQFPLAEPGHINIGILHTNVGGNTQIHKNYAPSTIDSLSVHGYEYFALGHVHKRAILCDSPYIAYSGNSQALSAKPSEQEPKGCVIVQIESPDGAVTSKFISTDVVRYKSCNINAKDFLEIDDAVAFAVEEITTACSDAKRLYLVRADIDLFAPVDSESIREAINDARTNFFVTSVKSHNSFKSFEELANQDPFYSSIHEVFAKTPSPSLKELYGTQSTTIERLIELDEQQTSIQDEASELILQVASKIQSSGSLS